MKKVMGAFRVHANTTTTDWNYVIVSFSSATFLQLFSKKALGRAQKVAVKIILSV
jgi:hypothetical protein